MTFSQFDPAMQNRVPWNAGAKVGSNRPLNKRGLGRAILLGSRTTHSRPRFV